MIWWLITAVFLAFTATLLAVNLERRGDADPAWYRVARLRRFATVCAVLAMLFWLISISLAVASLPAGQG